MKLDRRSTVPFYRQIYDRFREGISRGQLLPGDRLPSARSLSSQLGTARGTVDTAYSMLAGEGYIISRGAAGTIVAPGIAAAANVNAPDAAPLRGRKTSLTSEPSRRAEPDLAFEQIEPRFFQMGLPALDVFPRKVWTRLAMRRARSLNAATMTYPNPLGDPGLRDAIASYLAIARGIKCNAGQVVITSGYQGALGLICRLLLRPRDAVWLEDPGYFLAHQAFEAAGATIVPVPVDEDGLDVEAGLRRDPTARFAVVTPAHQAPLGVSLSLHRRLALLDWARQNGTWIVEDDYDSEFRYHGRPLPALKSLDQSDRVLYVGTFSKVLFPALRLGYLVIPESLIAPFTHHCRVLQPDSSAFSEGVIADFMLQGHFARHIRRMRQLYASRRAALATALAEQLSDRLHIQMTGGGMHLLGRPKTRESDRDLAQRAAALGLAVLPLSAFRIERDCGPGLLLSFTNIPVEAAPKAVKLLAQAMRGA